MKTVADQDLRICGGICTDPDPIKLTNPFLIAGTTQDPPRPAGVRELATPPRLTHSSAFRGDRNCVPHSIVLHRKLEITIDKPSQRRFCGEQSGLNLFPFEKTSSCKHHLLFVFKETTLFPGFSKYIKTEE
jgi:hypothetical protein